MMMMKMKKKMMIWALNARPPRQMLYIIFLFGFVFFFFFFLQQPCGVTPTALPNVDEEAEVLRDELTLDDWWFSRFQRLKASFQMT